MAHPKGLVVARSRLEAQAFRADLRQQGRTLAFVPTMGALHSGHLSLVCIGLGRADVVAASIFVNPTQFAANEDFGSYPRTEARDLEMLAGAGCAFAYCPGASEIYPAGDATRITVRDLSHTLEGAVRPHFFEGVATVVARLFLHVEPNVAIFGEKDFQQLHIIRRMTTDLGFPIEIVGGPTEREADGLAMSSRNAYLTPDERARAGRLYAVMAECANQASAGRPIAPSLEHARTALLDAGFAGVDYLELRAASDLSLIDSPALPHGLEARLLAAVRLGKTRLIDNLPVKRS
jgi:pantoate--beta-alanine ligase